MSDKPKVLYLSYDGMTDPLGQSQVLSYQRKLTQQGFSSHILSFDKPDLYASGKEAVQKSLNGYDVTWHSLPYTKSPPVLSTLMDIQAGWRKAQALYKQYGHFDIVHCRGYIPPIIGLRCKKKYGSKVLFDMRGWWPDEKLESGLWSSPVYKPIYNYFKGLEREFFQKSDYAISLTVAGQLEAEKLGYKSKDLIGVIPTCVDFNVFPAFSEAVRNEVRQELDIPLDAKVLLYSGSLGGNYGTDMLLEIFKEMLGIDPNAVLMVLSRTDRSVLDTELAKFNLPIDNVRLASANYSDVYRYLMAGDIGTIVYRPTYSVIGRSPTKLGEYWACGLPAVALSGVGDLDYLMHKYPDGGALIEAPKPQFYKAALAKLLEKPVNRPKLREYAFDYYDLEKGVARYKSFYQALL